MQIKVNKKNIIKNIASIFIVAMFFSCGNKIEDVNDFLSNKNLPIQESKNIHLTYTDSAIVNSKINAPKMEDFSNRKKHPYKEFPNGIEIITFNKNDSTKIKGDYAKTFDKTLIAEIKGHVEIYNYKRGFKLTTDQLYWDQKENYFFSTKKSALTSNKDTLIGLNGFDSNVDLTNATMITNSANLTLKN